MVEIVWEFKVRAGCEKEFERHYGPRGSWFELFRKDPNYAGTSLLHEPLTSRYLTVDRWKQDGDFERFKVTYNAQYAEIDSRMEALTESESKIGVFLVIEPV